MAACSEDDPKYIPSTWEKDQNKKHMMVLNRNVIIRGRDKHTWPSDSWRTIPELQQGWEKQMLPRVGSAGRV